MPRFDLLQPLPGRGFGQGVTTGQLAGQCHPLRGGPRGCVHAVGDRTDRHLGGVEAGPQFVEHVPADPAVQQRHPVGALRQPQAHVRHVELRRIVLGAERQHARPAGRRAAAGSADRRRSSGRTMSIGNRSMPAGTGVWVVNTVLARTTVSAVSKSRPAAGGHVLADPLDPEEPGVALVHVEDLGRRQPLDLGERTDRAHTADPGQDLLFDAVLLVAAVEPVGDSAHVVLVLRNVGVQQEQRHPADLGDPDPGPQLRPFRHRQVHQGRFPRLVGEQPQRQTLRVDATGTSRAASRRRSATAGSSPTGRAGRRRSAAGPDRTPI